MTTRFGPMLAYAVTFLVTFLVFNEIHLVLAGHRVTGMWAAADLLSSWMLTLDLFLQAMKEAFRE